jgi:hypothetical protein
MKGFRLVSLAAAAAVLVAAGCSTAYKSKPLPFKSPSVYPNMVEVEGALIASRAFTVNPETHETFGFDILGAGMLPVQVIFDNQGIHTLEINGEQCFLEDTEGSLWPVLSRSAAYERATRHTATEEALKGGASKAVWGALAGAIVGAAVGIVADEDIAEALGKGAAIGAAAGGVLGGYQSSTAGAAEAAIAADLQDKSLRNKSVGPKSLAHGFLFFPAEAKGARELRLNLKEVDTGNVYVLKMQLENQR